MIESAVGVGKRILITKINIRYKNAVKIMAEIVIMFRIRFFPDKAFSPVITVKYTNISTNKIIKQY